MKVIYFSPHLDDAIFSCGGIIAQQVKNGYKVEVWSFFTADPPAENLTPFARLLHRRWGKQGSPYEQRRQEDKAACRLLGVKSVHFNFADCIYRRYPSNNTPLIRKTSDLFKPTCEPEVEVEGAIWGVIEKQIAPDDQVVVPLGAGGHVDHALIKKVGCKLLNQKRFYSDFPYSGKLESVNELNLPGGAMGGHFVFSSDELALWQQAARKYHSQISSFWKSPEILSSEITRYASSPIGSTLWTIPESG
jgi:LmbE family N-acetylglucosaminyl deacetylase